MIRQSLVLLAAALETVPPEDLPAVVLNIRAQARLLDPEVVWVPCSFQAMGKQKHIINVAKWLLSTAASADTNERAAGFAWAAAHAAEHALAAVGK